MNWWNKQPLRFRQIIMAYLAGLACFPLLLTLVSFELAVIYLVVIPAIAFLLWVIIEDMLNLL